MRMMGKPQSIPQTHMQLSLSLAINQYLNFFHFSTSRDISPRNNNEIFFRSSPAQHTALLVRIPPPCRLMLFHSDIFNILLR